MYVPKNPLAVSLLFCLVFSPVAGPAKDKHQALAEAPGIAREKPAALAEAPGPAVLWTNPADIQSRNLFYGPGGSAHVPHGPFTFVKEDLAGTNPKFVVTDSDGVKWKVKLGIEARPETVASRLVWAVGYRANEDYFVPRLQVRGMPAHLHRGQKMIAPDGSVPNVRLKRMDEKKAGEWSWRQDAFAGTREWFGLRTLMAVINNWDLKDENNAIYQEHGQRIYMISDLGASFGCSNRCWPRDEAKGDIEKYRQSGFIRRVSPTTVSFYTPGRPRFLYMVNPKEYFMRVHLEWIGRNIPRADAKWMGALLARLSPAQVHDAFRAAGYSPDQIEAFSRILQSRITALTDL
ncbi:MAG TPA: hypothetical protein VME43_18025 [Bryobacteraceae bacterium]|nr:hypothetical protein [Bryobacteraceae bacterium]